MQNSYLFIVLLILGVLLFLSYNKQKKQLDSMKKFEQELDQLAPGTRVLLGNGFYGQFIGKQGKVCRIKLAPGIELEVDARAIAHVSTETEDTPHGFSHDISGTSTETIQRGFPPSAQVQDSDTSDPEPKNREE